MPSELALPEKCRSRAANAMHLAASLAAVSAACVALILWADTPLAHVCRRIPEDAREVFKWITLLGDATVELVPLGVIFALSRFVWRRPGIARAAAFTFVSVAASGITADLIKFLFGRTRPSLLFRENVHVFDFFRIEGAWTSFPSGHTAVVTAFMLCLAIFLPRLRLLWAAVAVTVASSRVILTAHYLSDVVFGAYVAMAVTLAIRRQVARKWPAVFEEGITSV